MCPHAGGPLCEHTQHCPRALPWQVCPALMQAHFPAHPALVQAQLCANTRRCSCAPGPCANTLPCTLTALMHTQPLCNPPVQDAPSCTRAGAEKAPMPSRVPKAPKAPKGSGGARGKAPPTRVDSSTWTSRVVSPPRVLLISVRSVRVYVWLLRVNVRVSRSCADTIWNQFPGEHPAGTHSDRRTRGDTGVDAVAAGDADGRRHGEMETRMDTGMMESRWVETWVVTGLEVEDGAGRGGHRDGWMEARVDEARDGHMDRCVNGHTDRHVDGGTGGWWHAQRDAWTQHRHIERHRNGRRRTEGRERRRKEKSELEWLRCVSIPMAHRAGEGRGLRWRRGKKGRKRGG